MSVRGRAEYHGGAPFPTFGWTTRDPSWIYWTLPSAATAQFTSWRKSTKKEGKICYFVQGDGQRQKHDSVVDIDGREEGADAWGEARGVVAQDQLGVQQEHAAEDRERLGDKG